LDSLWIVVFCVLFITLVILPARQRRAAAAHRIIKNKKKKGSLQMETLAKQFLDKECYIYSINDSYSNVRGIIREVTGAGLLVENKSGRQIINLDYVTRIQECPPKKSKHD